MREDGLIRIVKDAIIRQAALASDLKELLKLHNNKLVVKELQIQAVIKNLQGNKKIV